MKMCCKIAIRFIVMGLFLAGSSCQQNKQEKIEKEKKQLFQLIQTKNKNKHPPFKNENSEKGQINPQRGSRGIGNYDFGTVPKTNINFQPPVNSATDLKKQKNK